MSTNPAFHTKLLDNAGSGEDITWLSNSSSTVFSLLKGAVEIHHVDEGAEMLLWSGNDAGPFPDSTHCILDFYQGARLRATATAPGTILIAGKHDWLGQ